MRPCCVFSDRPIVTRRVRPTGVSNRRGCPSLSSTAGNRSTPLPTFNFLSHNRGGDELFVVSRAVRCPACPHGVPRRASRSRRAVPDRSRRTVSRRAAPVGRVVPCRARPVGRTCRAPVVSCPSCPSCPSPSNIARRAAPVRHRTASYGQICPPDALNKCASCTSRPVLAGKMRGTRAI